MKVTKSVVNLDIKITIELTENEARAFDSFAYFGAYEQTVKFIKTTWSNNINEKHLKELFETVHSEIHPYLSRIDKARKIFNEVEDK
jgi:hypothetical protein